MKLISDWVKHNCFIHYLSLEWIAFETNIYLSFFLIFRMMSEKTENISNLHLKDKDRLFGLNILHIFARLGGLRTYKKWSIFYTPFQVYKYYRRIKQV